MNKGLFAYRSTVSKIPQGLDRVWHRAAGTLFRASCHPIFFLRRAERVLHLHDYISQLSDIELDTQCQELRTMFRRGRETHDDTVMALAILREISRRIRGEHPYREQIAGVLAILSGCIAEMATGEGKTLSSALAAVVEGWRGHGCHLVTANDYLVRRDAEEMTAFYHCCGVSVKFVTESSSESERREAYGADVTYATNKTLAADFLKDQLLGQNQRLFEASWGNPLKGNPATGSKMIPGLRCALVDEADCILIDEAVTPLILSGVSGHGEEEKEYHVARGFADRLVAEVDFQVVEQRQSIELSESGLFKLGQWGAGVGGIFISLRRTEELVSQSLVARFFYHKNKQYVLHDNKVVIVDEFTGRLMPDREWRDGLHQAVAAREGVEISKRKETLGRISFQNFFRMYSRLSGMTGTAWEARQELWDIYSLPVVRIPTHNQCIRKSEPVCLVGTSGDKHSVIFNRITDSASKGRAVLIGTRSVKASQELSAYLLRNKLAHSLLNAESHDREAEIIKDAGQLGRITVATNMAGRGTDIKLSQEVKNAGGLVVILTERHESRRIDRQLFGRCGRQGDPGTVFEVLSVSDELFTRHFDWMINYVKMVKYPTGPMFRFFILILFKLAQHLTERQARLTRYSLVERNEALENALGFAGKEFQV